MTDRHFIGGFETTEQDAMTTQEKWKPRRNKDGTLHADDIEKITATTADADNLYVKVKVGRGKDTKGVHILRWAYRFTGPDGKRKFKTIGRVGSMTPTRARQIAGQMDQKLRNEGIDPRTHTPGGEMITLGEFAMAWVEEKIRPQAPTEPAAYKRMLERHMPGLAKLPIGTITMNDVKVAILPTWKTIQPTAAMNLRRLVQIFDAARMANKRGGENPARYKGGLEHLLSKNMTEENKKPRPAIEWQLAPKLVQGLRYSQEPQARCAEFAVLVAVRSQEARLIRWDQIDMQKAIWNAPKGMFKIKSLAAIIPLSTAAMTILRAMPRVGPFVFPSDFSTEHKPWDGHTLLNCIRDVGVVPPEQITAHGCRATMRTYAGENKLEEEFILEWCISHVKKKDATKDAYERSDMIERRRSVFERWGEHCTSTIPPARITPVTVWKRLANAVELRTAA
jgi:integrase